MNPERVFLAAQGYSELGMLEDAILELETLPKEMAKRPEILQFRLNIEMLARLWEKGWLTAKTLCEVEPESNFGFIQGAFCLHEQGKTQDALAFLLDGPVSLAEDATYHYNIACYHAVLGDFEQTKKSLEDCFKIDPSFQPISKEDPDLKTFWEKMQ